MRTRSILENATDEQLGLAVEENLFTLFRAMTALPNSQLEETRRLCRHLASPNNPMYKGVWGSCLESHEVEAAIDDSVEWFKSRGAPFFFWWTGPSSRPENIGDSLKARGFVELEFESREITPGLKVTVSGAPGMAANLHDMNENELARVPRGFEIHDLQGERDLQDFKRVLIEGYNMPPPMAEGWVESTHGFGIGRTPWRMFLGRLNGEPVATNIVLEGAGVAGIYGIAVTPTARGQGIGAAITLQPLLEARDLYGYNYAVLFSSEMGRPVYERIGFRMTGVRISRYLWRNGSLEI